MRPRKSGTSVSMVVAGRREVLTDGQHLDAVRAQVAHDLNDLLVGFADADHQAGLGRHLRVALLECLEEVERVLVVGAGAGLLVEARHGFQVVVEYVGQRLAEHVDGDLRAPAKVGNECLDGGRRRLVAYGGDDVDEVLGAAVAQVVAVDAGNDDVAQFQVRDAVGEIGWLFGVGRQRFAVADVAERAAARADVAEDHEGRRAAAEAFADIRAGGFLADGVQLLLAQHRLDLAEAAGVVAGLDADPRRLA